MTACSSPKEKQVPFPSRSSGEEEWVVYEGKILTDKGLEADIELSLMSAAVCMESYFELKKSLITKEDNHNWQSRGKYSVAYGLPGHEQGITINDPPIKIKGLLTSNKSVKVEAEGSEEFAKRLAKTRDLLDMPEIFFKTQGNEKLIQTDRSFDDKGQKYVLYRRSDLFTVEGYATCEDSVTEFFERNTLKNWNVARLGEINSIKIKYIELATEMNEGIYLKALAYSIADTTSKSNESLVIKRVLRVEKSSMQNPIK
jgi:hypothetical protein